MSSVDGRSPWARSSTTRFGNGLEAKTPTSRPQTAPMYSASSPSLHHYIGSASDCQSQPMLMSSPSALAAVPNGVYARALWSQENRRKVMNEARDKQERALLKRERARALFERVQLERQMKSGRERAAVEACKERKLLQGVQDRYDLMDAIHTTANATQYAIEHKVRQAKEASFGRVAAARQAAVDRKKQLRREEGIRQQFALEEKQRRLQNMRVEHAKKYTNKFALTLGPDWEQSQLFRYSPLARANHIPGSHPSLQSSASVLMNARQQQTGSPPQAQLGWLNLEDGAGQ